MEYEVYFGVVRLLEEAHSAPRRGADTSTVPRWGAKGVRSWPKNTGDMINAAFVLECSGRTHKITL